MWRFGLKQLFWSPWWQTEMVPTSCNKMFPFWCNKNSLECLQVRLKLCSSLIRKQNQSPITRPRSHDVKKLTLLIFEQLPCDRCVSLTLLLFNSLLICNLLSDLLEMFDLTSLSCEWTGCVTSVWLPELLLLLVCCDFSVVHYEDKPSAESFTACWINDDCPQSSSRGGGGGRGAASHSGGRSTTVPVGSLQHLVVSIPSL